MMPMSDMIDTTVHHSKLEFIYIIDIQQHKSVLLFTKMTKF